MSVEDLDNPTKMEYDNLDVNVKVVHSMKDKMRIGEFAEHAGVTPRTVRYYEGLGLLSVPNYTPISPESRSTSRRIGRASFFCPYSDVDVNVIIRWHSSVLQCRKRSLILRGGTHAAK